MSTFKMPTFKMTPGSVSDNTTLRVTNRVTNARQTFEREGNRESSIEFPFEWLTGVRGIDRAFTQLTQLSSIILLRRTAALSAERPHVRLNRTILAV